MSYVALRDALLSHLATLSTSPQPDIVWDNGTYTTALGVVTQGDYKPSTSQPFIQSYLLPVDNRPISTNPIQHHTSLIFEVRCMVGERERGRDGAFALADAVSALFFPTTNETLSLSAGSYTIHIDRKPDQDPLPAQGGFVGVAVLVRCFALT